MEGRATLGSVAGALDLAAHVVRRDPRQLGGQLAGRLHAIDDPGCRSIVSTIRSSVAGVVPVGGVLSTPGGARVRHIPTQADFAGVWRSTLVVAGRHTLEWWDLEAGLLLRSVRVDVDQIDEVVLSGGFLATRSRALAEVGIWSIGDGVRVSAFSVDADTEAMALSPTGRHLITVGRGGMRLRSSETGVPLLSQPVVDAPVRICVDSSGLQVVVGHWRGGLTLWSLADDATHTLVSSDGPPEHLYRGSAREAILVTPDGRTALFAANRAAGAAVRLLDLETGELRGSLEVAWGGSVPALAVTPDGALALGAGMHRGSALDIQVWSLETLEEVGSLPGLTEFTGAIAVTDDGRHAITGDRYHTIVWDLDAMVRPPVSPGDRSTVRAIASDPSKAWVATAGDGGTIQVWTPERHHLGEMVSGASIRVAAAAGDGQLLTGSRDGAVRLWSPLDLSLIDQVAEHVDAIRAMAVDPTGAVAVSGSIDGTAHVVDLVRRAIRSTYVMPEEAEAAPLPEGKVVRRLPGVAARPAPPSDPRRQVVTSVAIHPAMPRAAIGGTDGVVRIIETGGGAVQREIDTETGLSFLAWLVDSHLVTYSGGDVQRREPDELDVQVWDADSGDRLFNLGAQVGPVDLVGVAGGGRYVAVVSVGTLLVFDSSDGHLRWSAPIWGATCLASPPSGRLLVVGDAAGGVTVWEVDTGRRIGAFTGEAEVTALHAPADDLVVSGDEIGTAHFLRIGAP